MNEICLVDWFDDYRKDVQFNIEEKLSFVNIVINSKSLVHGLFEDFFAQLLLLPDRDHFRVNISNGTENKEFSSADSESLRDFISIYEETINLGGHFEVAIKIEKKCKDGFWSVYFPESLDEYFGVQSKVSLLKELNENYGGGISFSVFSNISRFGSRLIFFATSGQAGPINSGIEDRGRIIGKFNDNCAFSKHGEFFDRLAPSDFYSKGATNLTNIKAFFEYSFLLFSISFLSNNSDVRNRDGQEILISKIYGYKTIEISLGVEESKGIQIEYLYKLYEWIYLDASGSAVEKFGLVRNLISLHASDSSRPVIDDVLWSAVRSNYKIYLQENVQLYIEAKGKISDVLTASIERTQSVLDGYVASVRAAISIVCVFLLTVVLVNGFKDAADPSKIFTFLYFFVVCIVVGCSAYWIWFVSKDAQEQFNDIEKNVGQLIKSSYQKVLLPSEIEDSLRESESRNKVYLQKYLKKYQLFLSGFLILFVGLYFLGVCIFDEKLQNFLKDAVSRFG